MTPGRPPQTPKRLDKPDELTTRSRRGAIYDARMTAADAKRPFLNSPKTGVNIRPAAYDRPHCHHTHAPPE